MANQITSNYKLISRSGMLKFQYSNQRKAVRYIRNDIDAAVTKIKVFHTNKLSYVMLHDVCTRGAFISTDLNLSLNKKLTLTLAFALKVENLQSRQELYAKIISDPINTDSNLTAAMTVLAIIY